MNRLAVAAQPGWREPRDCFAEFAARPHCVWLDTATAPPGQSILAAEPAKIFRAKGRQVEIISASGTLRFQANPFDALAQQLRCNPAAVAIGYFGYELKNCLENLPQRALDDLALPDCWFGFYEHLLVFDHTGRKIRRIGRRPGHIAHAANPANKCHDRHKIDGCWQRPESNVSREEYVHAVLRAKDYIAAGDIYQVNLSQRFQCSVEASAVELYLALRETNPAPYGAYLDIGEAQILSTSPECFLRINDRHVLTRPIKGTLPRERDPQQLLRSPKDNAELVMITDLERNDLGRVCQYGSVRVTELRRVETFATVHHLVSTVEGLLRPGVSHLDCVRACFPGGSITGAPKIRAMQIIDELEPHARGVYTGAIGYFSPEDESQFNIAIRTVVYQRGRLTFHAGGGIVADSDPDAEYQETLAKTRGIFNAIDQLRIRQRPVCA